jgi:hypothetical protein
MEGRLAALAALVADAPPRRLAWRLLHPVRGHVRLPSIGLLRRDPRVTPSLVERAKKVCNVARLNSDAASERLLRLLSEVAALRGRLGVLEGLVIRRGLAPEASALLLQQQEQWRGAGGRAEEEAGSGASAQLPGKGGASACSVM